MALRTTSGLPMRARCRRRGTSTPAWRSAARRRGRARFASREVPRCRSGDRAASAGARRGRGASRSASFGDGAQLYSTSDVVTTRPELRRPRPGGRPPEPGRGPRRPPEQAGPAQVPAASVSGLSCRRCTPDPGARRALLDIGPQGRSLVRGLVSQHPPAGAVKGLGDQGGLHQESRRVARDRTTSGGCRDEPAMSDYDPPSLNEAARPGLGIAPSPGPGLVISALQCGCDW
jgi:hypothetical protein